MNFSSLIFTDQQAPLSAEGLTFHTNGLFAPASDAERKEVMSTQQNQWPTHRLEHATWAPIDPIDWRFPSHPIPTKLCYIVTTYGWRSLCQQRA
ncbi:MAG: hypothetical protein GFH27_549347n1 [Chloroflexi bacterium AL-W]|nr:hypothetical protein [Chloroflexi bacterium AL-N1]NOK70783.1 hypothetical protein [Chloroflexi bacterium AL-N10]NOK78343.1 hypothetical protein [Chloroflexi bacterium AL-N5]NOK85324.1 hypothetical protein [Chloroflexi bacterium AL-W]NOK92600.1 hypothetical protein [Chloroflexi bacterium AL-N15]